MVISFGTFRIHVSDLIFTHFFESVHRFVRNKTYVCKDILINRNKAYWVHCAGKLRKKNLPLEEQSIARHRCTPLAQIT